jgi:acyl dehydratase
LIDQANVPDIRDDVLPGKKLSPRYVTITSASVQNYRASLDLGADRHTAGPGAGSITESLTPPLLLCLMPWRWPGSVVGYHNATVAAAMTWHNLGPSRVGDKLELSATVVDRFIRRQNECVTTAVEARIAGRGDLVFRASATLSAPVDVGMVAASIERREPTESLPTPGLEQDTATTTALPELRTMITAQMSARFWQDYSALPASRNIHVNVEAAHQRGLPHLVIAGPHILAMFSEHLTTLFGTKWTDQGAIAAKFVRPLFAGEPAVITPTLVGRAGSHDWRRLRLTCAAQSGRVVAVADADIPADS